MKTVSSKHARPSTPLPCSKLYGPRSAKPLLSATPGLISNAGQPSSDAPSDVITNLAKRSFKRYDADRVSSGEFRGYDTFADQPLDLRNSSIEHIMSIPAKLETLGYEIVPDGGRTHILIRALA